MSFRLSFLFLLGLFSLDHSAKAATQKLRVTTTTGMVADLARHVGGTRVEVTALMGPGVDPHLYKASAGDIRKLQSADLVFYSGLHLEGKLVDLLDKLPKAVAVTSTIKQNQLIQPKGGFGGQAGLYDPHVWFDVNLWKQTIQAVQNALTRKDPAGRQIYANNAQQYKKQLEALDKQVLSIMKRVPKQKRILITAHDAFEYFGRRYDVQVRGLQGISTTTEASTRSVQELARFIVKNKIPAIFVESSVPKRTIEAVVSAVRAQNWQVRIGGELYSDAMGAKGTKDGTYVGMVLHNAQTISDALLK